MNATIVKIIGLLFEDIEETEETRAIHDEILTNCQERYEDLLHGGMNEDDAIHAVIESLNGMEEMLKEYPRKKADTAESAIESSDWTLDPAQTPIYEIHCLHMGSTDITVEASADGLLHVQCEDDSVMLMTSIDAGVLSIALSDPEEKPSIHTEFSFDLSNLGNLFEKIARRFAGMISSCRIRISLPQGLGLSLQMDTASGDVEIGSVALENLTVSTASGDIMLNDLTAGGFLRLNTASGDICGNDLCLAGEIHINTASGDVTMHDVCTNDSVRLNSASGDMEWQGSCCDLQANTSSGDLRLDGAFASGSFHTNSGDADVSIRGGALHSLQGKTSSGDMRVLLPAELELCISCHSSSGDIRQQRASRPESAAVVELSSNSGDITVR